MIYLVDNTTHFLNNRGLIYKFDDISEVNYTINEIDNLYIFS